MEKQVRFCYIDNAVQANLLSAYADKQAETKLMWLMVTELLNELYKILAQPCHG